MKIHIGKHEFKKRKLIAVVMVVLFAALTLGGAVYAVTTDLGGIGTLLTGGGIRAAAVPPEAEEAGYTRGLRIDPFTVNGLYGSNTFCLTGAERESISFYNNPDEGAGGAVSSSNGFNITAGNSFLIDPTLDTVRIVAPRQGNCSSKYLGVNGDGLDITDSTFIMRYIIHAQVPYPVNEMI